MRLYQRWLCVVSLFPNAIISTALAATLPHLDTNNIIVPAEASSPQWNHSSSIGAYSQYMIAPVFNGPSLDQTSLLMSAVQLMAREAAENVNHNVGRIFWNSPDPRFSNIGILVAPPSNAATMPRRLMIWGLTEGPKLLMQRNRFASVKLRMTRDGINIGSIEFAHLRNNRELHLDADRSTASSVNISPSSPQPAPTTNTTHTPTNAIAKPDNNTLAAVTIAGFAVYCRPHGYDLEISDVFRPVLTMLSYVAQYPPGAHFQDFRTDAEIGQTALGFKSRGRRVPPFFFKEDVVKATAVVPLFMINKGRFSELDVRVLMDEQLLATGGLKIERTPPPRPHRDVSVV